MVTSKRIRLALALVAMPVLAICAAMASLSTVLEVSMPDRAIGLPIVNANAYASAASEVLAGQEAPGGKDLAHLAVDAGVRTFNAEPTNAAALSLMASGKLISGDISAARRLNQDALLVAPRERQANLWLLEDASQHGLVDYILDRYDVLLRTGGIASDVLFDVLGSALREAVMVPYLEQRLVRRPPWSEQFWLRVTPHTASLANVARLRLRLIDRGVGNPAGNDADILRRLAESGQFDVGFNLFHRLNGDAGSHDRVIQNEEFAKPARFPPFDWETYSNPSVGSELDPASSALVVYAQDSVDALVARQLINAAPGEYRLQYRVRVNDSSRAIRASIKAHCAAPDDRALLTAPMDAGSGTATISVSAPDCRYIWLEVWAHRDAASSATGSDDLLIDAIAMRPAGGMGRADPGGVHQ